MSRVCAAALVVLAVFSHAEAAKVTPVQKVLEMMTEMKVKGDKMLAEEVKTYATYKEWVSDTSRELGFEIKTAKSDIEKFTAAAGKADSDVAQLRSAISKLEGELGDTEGEKQEATDVRKEQHAEYLLLSTDYGESVDALERAIQTMEARSYNVPEAEAFLQKMAITKPAMRRVLAAFIQETQKQEVSRGSGAPSVNAYEFQSSGIVALLEKLLKKFKGELDEVETEEANEAHNYDLVMIQLSDTIDYLKKEIEEKSVTKSKRAAESAQAKSDLAATQAELAEDEKTLADMMATFEAKTSQYEANQEVRKQELEAINKAIEIISDPTVAGSFKEHINLVEVKTSFLQVRSASTMSSRRVAAFLKKKGQLLSSSELKNLAAQVAGNPFDKVVKMIEDLLAKLKEEAAAEAEHKAWCDEQLHNNKLKRDKKTSQVNKLTAEIEAKTEEIAAMAKKIVRLAKEQAELTKAMEEATAQRIQEKATNTDTMKDAAAGEEATKAALVILKEFYSSQSFLLQQQQVPEMAAYKGMQSAKGGVVGMLEVISSDFARLFADTKASEEAAATEYAGFMKDANASNKAKHDLEFKTSLKKDAAEFDKSELEKDLEATQEELDRALDYQQYLKPVCLEVHVSYEERVARRKEEIAALNEAYGILDQKA